METSKQVMEQMGVLPRLRLSIKRAGGGIVSTGPHRVKIIKDKPAKVIKNNEEVDGIRYLFEENGEHKVYERPTLNKEGKLDYFVERMAEFSEGDELMLESKKIGTRNYVEIIPLSKSRSAQVADDDADYGDEEPPEPPTVD